VLPVHYEQTVSGQFFGLRRQAVKTVPDFAPLGVARDSPDY